jgi:hypothetical protein
LFSIPSRIALARRPSRDKVIAGSINRLGRNGIRIWGFWTLRRPLLMVGILCGSFSWLGQISCV